MTEFGETIVKSVILALASALPQSAAWLWRWRVPLFPKAAIRKMSDEIIEATEKGQCWTCFKGQLKLKHIHRAVRRAKIECVLLGISDRVQWLSEPSFYGCIFRATVPLGVDVEAEFKHRILT